jgi:hypothetical protein
VVVLHLTKGPVGAAQSVPAAQPAGNQATDVATFPASIIGKWQFAGGVTSFPFSKDTEFTKDGRVLMFNYGTKKFDEERYTYRFEGAELVLTSSQKNIDGKLEERRVMVASISADLLEASSPAGKLRRMK